MRYERPAIEARVEMQALGLIEVSGGGGDTFTQPVWRSEKTDTDQRPR